MKRGAFRTPLYPPPPRKPCFRVCVPSRISFSFANFGSQLQGHGPPSQSHAQARHTPIHTFQKSGKATTV